MKIQGAVTLGRKLGGRSNLDLYPCSSGARVVLCLCFQLWHVLTVCNANLAGDTTKILVHQGMSTDSVLGFLPQQASFFSSTQLPCSAAMARGVALREQMRGQHRAAAYVGQPSKERRRPLKGR